MSRLITPKQYVDFRKKFASQQKFQHQRLGQAFMNEFFPHEANPSLFYETDWHLAEVKIWEQYIDSPRNYRR